MKIVATLACRNNSTRLYGKPLQLLKDFTIVEYIINNLKRLPEIDSIVLAISESSGNEGFVELAKRNNVKYVVGSDSDVLSRIIAACDLVGGDTIYRVTTESPFGYIEGLKEAVESHAKTGADYTTHGQLPDGVLFELIKLDALRRAHKEGTALDREHVSLYVVQHPTIFKLNILQIDAAWRRPDYRLTVDFPEDLILCRKIIRHFGGDSAPIPYRDLIKFLDENPELRKLVENVNDETYLKPLN